MENSIAVQGQMEFMGLEIPVVYGGFGRNQMCITDKTVSEIHGMTAFNVRARINSNIKRFKNGIDYIDLKIVIHEINNNLLEQLGYSKMQIAKAEHIFLLSERGIELLLENNKPSK